MSANPYALLRGLTGMNQTEFAAKHGMSRQTLVHIELATYPTLSERMIVELGKECHAKGIVAREVLQEHYGVGTLSAAYELWRNADRGTHAEKINRIQPTTWSAKLSPMHFVVKAFGSVQGFSKAMKIPAATLLRYIRGKQREMPRSIEEAFRAIDYPFLTQLIQNQAAWVDEHGGE